MTDLCQMCRVDPALEPVGDLNLCPDCATDYRVALEATG